MGAEWGKSNIEAKKDQGGKFTKIFPKKLSAVFDGGGLRVEGESALSTWPGQSHLAPLCLRSTAETIRGSIPAGISSRPTLEKSSADATMVIRAVPFPILRKSRLFWVPARRFSKHPQKTSIWQKMAGKCLSLPLLSSLALSQAWPPSSTLASWDLKLYQGAPCLPSDGRAEETAKVPHSTLSRKLR